MLFPERLTLLMTAFPLKKSCYEEVLGIPPRQNLIGILTGAKRQATLTCGHLLITSACPRII